MADTTIDFHALSAKIHGWKDNTVEHWDELVCKYLKSEVIDPVALSQNELAKSIAQLAEAVTALTNRLDDSKALKPEDDSQLVTANEAARMMKLHPRTVILLAKQGDIAGYRIGNGQWRFKRGDLRAAAKVRGKHGA